MSIVSSGSDGDVGRDDIGGVLEEEMDARRRPGVLVLALDRSGRNASAAAAVRAVVREMHPGRGSVTGLQALESMIREFSQDIPASRQAIRNKVAEMHAEAVAEATALESASTTANQLSTKRIVGAFESYHPLLKSFLSDMLTHHRALASAETQKESVATNAKIDKLVTLMQVRKALEDVILKKDAPLDVPSNGDGDGDGDDPEFVRVGEALRGAVQSAMTKMRSLTDRAELPDVSKRLDALQSIIAKAEPGDVPTIAGACSQLQGVYDTVQCRCAAPASSTDDAASPDETRLNSLERRTRLMMMREMGEEQSRLLDDDLSRALARATEARETVTKRSKAVVDDMLQMLEGGGASVSALLRQHDGEIARSETEAVRWGKRADQLASQTRLARTEASFGERDLARMALLDPQYQTTVREIAETARSLDEAHRELQTRQTDFEREERARDTLERLALEDSSRERLEELARETDETEARIVGAQTHISDEVALSASQSLDRLRMEMGRYVHTLAGGGDALSSLEEAVRMSTHDIGARTRARILSERLMELAD